MVNPLFFVFVLSSICPALGTEEVRNPKTLTGTDRNKMKTKQDKPPVSGQGTEREGGPAG